jgi:hypothetical protein
MTFSTVALANCHNFRVDVIFGTGMGDNLRNRNYKNAQASVK